MDNEEHHKPHGKGLKGLCEGCTLCCEYVTIELDDPTERLDFEEIIWMILHKDVIVYIDDENTWNVEFRTPCKELGSDGMCKVYDTRSQICRDYSHDECEKHGKGDYYQVVFKTKQDVLDYVYKNTEIRDLN